MRPVDLARAAGVSQQSVRTYEAAGVLPPALRRANGYRDYGDRHRAALQAFRALVGATSHETARAIMVDVNTGRTAAALERLDGAHAQLVADRGTIRALEDVLEDAERNAPDESRFAWLTPADLARRIGVTTTALRGWERAGALTPLRLGSGHRRYRPEDVLDAELIHLLRRAGHPLARIAEAVREIRAAGSSEQARLALHASAERIERSSRSLLAAGAALGAYLDLCDSSTS